MNLCLSLILAKNKERGKSGPSDESDKGKFVAEEKEKRTSRRTRIGIDFDPKISKLSDQKAVDKYWLTMAFAGALEKKVQFCLNDVDVTSAPPDKKGVYMHPLVLALRLRLPMTKFFHSILTFYEVALLSYRQWPGVQFEALCDFYTSEACHCEVFNAAYLLQKTTISARYFIPHSGVEKIIVNMVNSDRGMQDTVTRVFGPWDADSEEECKVISVV